MSVLPMTTTEDSTTRRMFEHPDAIRGDGPELIFCGHYDGHDVYRRLDVDLWVLVYGNSTEAIFEVFGSKAWRWLAEVKDPSCDTRHWGSMRAIVKAKRSIGEKLSDLWCALSDIARNVDGSTGEDWRDRVVASCSDAADVVYLFRKGVGI
jgi:hypothetical protein